VNSLIFKSCSKSEISAVDLGFSILSDFLVIGVLSTLPTRRRSYLILDHARFTAADLARRRLTTGNQNGGLYTESTLYLWTGRRYHINSGGYATLLDSVGSIRNGQKCVGSSRNISKLILNLNAVLRDIAHFRFAGHFDFWCGGKNGISDRNFFDLSNAVVFLVSGPPF